MKKRSREAASPDITPLIDVVFLLLIFFMTSTVFKKDELALLLSLPKATKGESAESPAKSLFIELSASEVAIDGKKTTFEELEITFKNLKKKTDLIDLRIDKEVRYERVVKLLDLLKKNDLSNISLITET